MTSADDIDEQVRAFRDGDPAAAERLDGVIGRQRSGARSVREQTRLLLLCHGSRTVPESSGEGLDAYCRVCLREHTVGVVGKAITLAPDRRDALRLKQI